MHIPLAFALINAQDDAGAPGGVDDGRVKQQETRPQLGHRNGVALDNQVDPDIGGVAALTAGPMTHG